MHYIKVTGGSGGTIKYSKDGSSWSKNNIGRNTAGTTRVYVKVDGEYYNGADAIVQASVTLDKKTGKKVDTMPSWD